VAFWFCSCSAELTAGTIMHASRIHRLFSNVKRWSRASITGCGKPNLQHYLDEFVLFRFNRRRTRHAAFDTLIGIGVHLPLADRDSQSIQRIVRSPPGAEPIREPEEIRLVDSIQY
jgi:hypothetical protein